ncbi:MAG: hypothetical protein P8O17_02840, partial [Candidatus Marinimicrobia bacterium]|nr:hypothetical protein [Candidatus Neomarinimicrobiota bacterium]
MNAKGTGTVSSLSDLSVTSTATELNILDGVTATAAELNYVDGVTSNIQTQLDAKGTGTVSSLSDLSITSTATELNILDGVTSTTGELNILDGVTATAAELNYVDGVTSNIQTQLDAVSGVTGLDGLTDVKSGGSSFSNSLIVGHQTTGTLNNAIDNVGLGFGSLESITSGDNNTAIGKDAMSSNTSGFYNVGIGHSALGLNIDGHSNTGVGDLVFNDNTSGFYNVGIGRRALQASTTSGYNVAVGAFALGAANRTADTDGYNTAIGYTSGTTGFNNITTGNKNTLLGAFTGISSGAGTNQVVIGYNTTGKGNNTVTIGNGDITTWTSTDDGEVDLGSSSVEFKDLYVDGVAYADAIGFGSTAMTVPTADGSNGQVLITDGNGALSWSSTAGNATRASTLTITDNENTNESNALIFTAGGDVDGGDLGLESDGDATYNPSTGVITATGFSGNLTGTLQTAAQTNVTSLGTLSGLTVSGEASVTTLDIGGTNVTSTAAELNIMDGNTSASSTTIVDADQIVLNDSGIMKQIAMTDLANYVASSSDLDILTDAKSEGTNFTGSLILGHQTTGTLDAAQYNTGVGLAALDAITAGDNNTAIGNNALSDNTTG